MGARSTGLGQRCAHPAARDGAKGSDMSRPSQTTTVENDIPQWVEDASRSNLDHANRMGQIGHVPYAGPVAAAFSPMQEAAMGNAQQMAEAYGMPSGGGQAYMPEPEQFGGEGGVSGYGSLGIYDDAMQRFAEARPGQAEALASMTMDPVTG